MFRGGLTADLQRLMPVDSGNDLFMYMFPDHPTNLIYKIRQYRHEVQNNYYSYIFSLKYFFLWKYFSLWIYLSIVFSLSLSLCSLTEMKVI